MELHDYYPLILVVAVLVGGVVALRVFFTLWEPIERRINGDKRGMPFSPFDIDELKDRPVNIYLKSGILLSGAILLGYCSSPPSTPFNFRHLLKARLPDETSAYIALSEINYLNESKRNI